ncbi:hypothetical protein PYCCODRAFT_796894 [Trametes coccinea BRFM310]|uniref:F-box domain-containing protein n=1 Tax=Trametes coccinea (strain BRFM310) TaxID=1353009 RepID=A0A1Y2J144_TRAC3|nr:hypothetical protein PYCCODRAFT_796894 [Trametes coccinea BRFM310]
MWWKKLRRRNRADVASIPATSPSLSTGVNVQATHDLRRLNDDVLLQIYQELRPKHGLQPLSLTCRWVRESVKPVLFSSCRQDARGLTWECFIPRQFWPYIRELLFFGVWAQIDLPDDDRYDAPFPLRQALSEMPQLTSVSIVGTLSRGVPRTAQVAVLSHPQLRTFDVTGPLYAPRSTNVPTFTAAPLTCYRQVVSDFRRTRYSLADSLLLCVVVNQPQVMESLEVLEVPSEFAPIALIAERRWPRLKRVALRGENWRFDRPVVDVMSQMPALQELVLTLAHPNRTNLHRLCPPDWASPLPWPELKTLSLTYPDPSDPIFSWLPTTLRHLVLSCWPRHFFFQRSETRLTMNDLGWGSPIQNSSAMVNILRRCQCSQLDSLEIEFVGSESDMELFRLIADAFPDLSSLTMFRYRPQHTTAVLVREIGEALEPLRRLRYLYLYLDFPEAPRPVHGGFHFSPIPNPHAQEEHDRIMRIFEQSADSIARCLSPTLSIISFLLLGASVNRWIPFRVQHPGDGLFVRHAPRALEEDGLL